MCGIVAICDPRATVSELEGTARAMVARQRRRGPDAQGVWVAEQGSVALGHARLAIRGLGPEGNQPMMDAAGTGVLVYGGELFGCEPLRDELERDGTRFRGTSDTEVLVEALARGGVKRVLGDVRGQFAFAWYAFASRELVFARDPLGIRPLYYAVSRGRLALASEQKALLLLEWIDTTLDTTALLRFLVMGRTDDVPGATLLSGLRSLPAGHLARWDGSALTIDRYHRIPTDVAASTASSVRSELERAIDEQLVSDVPIGSMVSGGLDSSTVTLLADRVRSRRGASDVLHLFAYHDALAERDEREYQRAVIDAVLTPKKVHWVSSSPDELRASYEQYVAHQEEPYADVSSYAEFCVARRAAAEGVKVLLSGTGGDEVFAGYPSFLGPLLLDALHRGALGVVAQVLKVTPAIEAKSALVDLRWLGAAGYHALPARMRNALMALRASASAELPPRLALRTVVDGFRTWHPHDGRPRVNAAQRGALESWSVPRFLAHSDRMTLAHGVEGRVPLLDLGVIRAAFGLNPLERFGATGLKAGLRAAVADVLPPLVRDRAWKQGFHAPVGAYVRALDRVLERDAREVSRYLDVAPAWEASSPAVRWRWGMLGAYLRFVRTARLRAT